jgi:hypothetical protein
MNLQNIPFNVTKTNMLPERIIFTKLQRLPQYFICAGLGALGGAVGVAVAIGAAILTQSLLVSTVISPLNIVFITILIRVNKVCR